MASMIMLIIDSGNGLSANRCQTITKTNDTSLSTEPLRTNLEDIWNQIHKFPFRKILLKMSSQCWTFCAGLIEDAREYITSPIHISSVLVCLFPIHSQYNTCTMYPENLALFHAVLLELCILNLNQIGPVHFTDTWVANSITMTPVPIKWSSRTWVKPLLGY